LDVVMGALAYGMLVLSLLSAPVAAAPVDLPATLLSADGDRVIATTVVPDDVRKVGEVRLVARGEATVVQTLLATKVLNRVVGEIRTKEEGNWPPGSAGRESMERYLSALFRTADALVARRESGDAGERRLRLLIEFVASPEAAGVLVGEFTGDEVDGHITPTARRPMETIALPRAYVLRNMRLILADAFHVPEAEIGKLGPLGVIAAAP
jgi:hypothetical protein